MLTEAEKAKRADKIRKLHAFVADPNTNKNAMNAAIDRMQEMQAELGITLEEILKGGDDLKLRYQTETRWSGERGFQWVDDMLWKDIARFTSCKVRPNYDPKHGNMIEFFGEEADVNLACWVRSTIKAAGNFEWGIYRDATNPKDMKVAMRSYLLEFTREVRTRMSAAVRKAPPTSTALIVTKNQVLADMAKEHNFVEPDGVYRAQGKFDESAGAFGREAGKRVDLGRAVGNRGVKQLT